MSGITIANTLQFLLSNNPAVLRMTDTTDYSGHPAGAAHNDTIIGLLQVYDPSGGLLYQSTQYGQSVPTIGDLYPYAASSPITIFDIQLPIDPTTNFPLLGEYTLNYQVYINQASGTALNGTYNISSTFTVSTIIPLVDVDTSVDCISGFISATDNTNYGNYTSLTRVLNLYYPASLQLDPETSSLATVMGALYTTPNDETYVAQVTSTVSYTVGNSTVTYVVSGSIGKRVVCSQSLCDVACQINKLQDKYFEALCSNMTLAKELEKELFQITQLMIMINTCIDCGQTTRVNGLLDRIYKIGHFSENGCGCGCGGDNDKPQLIVGRAGNPTLNTYSASGSNGIQVTTTTSGNNSTFGVKVGDGLYNVLSGLKKTALVAGDGVTIDSSTSSDGATTTYTITANTSSATIGISQVTGLQSALDGKQTTTLTDSHILMGNGSNVATSVAVSGDVAITNTGVTTVNAINGATVGTSTATSGNLLIGQGSSWVTKTVSGDATLASSGALTLASSGVSAGTYTSVTVDAKGRVTAGSNPGYITGNQTITLSGDVSGSGTTAITTSIGANKITNTMLQSNSVASGNIQSGAILSTHYGTGSIPTAAYQAGSVDNTALASNAVGVSNLTSALQSQVLNIQISLESEEVGTMNWINPFAGAIQITKVKGSVVKQIAGTDQGTITFANNAGNMDGAGILAPASSVYGFDLTDYIPTLNTTIASGTQLAITSAKTTPGGKILLTIYFNRL